MQDVHFDFEAALVLATVVTGVFWILERLIWSRRRGNGSRAGWLVEFACSFFPVILAVLVLRSFVVEPFRIPSPSMVPTLLHGDFILVSKFSYGLRLPVLHTQFVPWGEPDRGDVAVFRWPPEPDKDFIKRIVGLPGDTVVYRDKQLYINGEPVPLEPLGLYDGEGVAARERAMLNREILADHNHRVLTVPGRQRGELRVEVPAGHYFAMGDNRDHSMDSRSWGFVPERNLVGPAFLIWMSVDTDPIGLRWGRIGDAIE